MGDRNRIEHFHPESSGRHQARTVTITTRQVGYNQRSSFRSYHHGRRWPNRGQLDSTSRCGKNGRNSHQRPVYQQQQPQNSQTRMKEAHKLVERHISMTERSQPSRKPRTATALACRQFLRFGSARDGESRYYRRRQTARRRPRDGRTAPRRQRDESAPGSRPPDRRKMRWLSRGTLTNSSRVVLEIISPLPVSYR